MKIIKTVVAKTRFEGFHNWPAAPDEVAFLRKMHRHEFHVEVQVDVNHNDREVEFILLKRAVDKFCQENYAGLEGHWSCEMIAEQIRDHFKARLVKVFEDGENGAIVMRTGEERQQVDYCAWCPNPKDPSPEFYRNGGPSHEEPESPPLPPGPYTSSLPSWSSGQVKADWVVFDDAVLKAATEHLAAPVRTGPVLDHLKVKHKCFVGTEAEGPRRGMKTLFVPASVRPIDLPKPDWIKEQGIEHVYYGAGNDQSWRGSTWDAVLHVPNVHVTAEARSISEVRAFPAPARVTLVTLDNKDIELSRSVGINFYKEIVGDRIIWWKIAPAMGFHNFRACYVTRIDDPLFAQDKDVPDDALQSR